MYATHVTDSGPSIGDLTLASVSKLRVGFETTGIYTTQSGRPLNPIGWNAAGQVVVPESNRLNATGISPNLPSGQRTIQRWFNVAAPIFSSAAGTREG